MFALNLDATLADCAAGAAEFLQFAAERFEFRRGERQTEHDGDGFAAATGHFARYPNAPRGGARRGGCGLGSCGCGGGFAQYDAAGGGVGFHAADYDRAAIRPPLRPLPRDAMLIASSGRIANGLERVLHFWGGKICNQPANGDDGDQNS